MIFAAAALSAWKTAAAKQRVRCDVAERRAELLADAAVERIGQHVRERFVHPVRHRIGGLADRFGELDGELATQDRVVVEHAEHGLADGTFVLLEEFDVEVEDALDHRLREI